MSSAADYFVTLRSVKFVFSKNYLDFTRFLLLVKSYFECMLGAIPTANPYHLQLNQVSIVCSNLADVTASGVWVSTPYCVSAFHTDALKITLKELFTLYSILSNCQLFWWLFWAWQDLNLHYVVRFRHFWQSCYRPNFVFSFLARYVCLFRHTLKIAIKEL